ncbi:Rrf2 family transcriptional regulator [Pacificimonas sp. ICDLI1SI03]
MQLSVYSDYALRLLMQLALCPDRLVTIQEVADSYGISKNHLMKVAHRLGVKDHIETVRGRNGGLRLARPPSRINVGGIIRDTEDNLALVECFDSARNTCVISPSCRLKHVLNDAMEAFFQVLDEYTIADLTQNAAELTDLLQFSAMSPDRTSQ